MLSLSVKRQGFTDKLFKINNLSGRRRCFTDKITFCETTIIGNNSRAYKKCGVLRRMGQHRIGLSRTTVSVSAVKY